MKFNCLSLLAGTCLISAACFNTPATEPAKTIPLWPDIAPGEKGGLGEERDLSKSTDNSVAGKPVIRLGNVARPTLSLYRPPVGKENGAAVLVCPGGGYHILAMDLEGTEICEWLNSLGITAGLLKYRVPKREGLEKHAAPLQDAQRALGLMRFHARDWGLNPRRLGVLGFSAGGHLAAVLSNHNPDRTYPLADDADKVSCHPDFSVLVYPAYLTVKEQGDALAPELPVTTNTPPAFLVMAEDDPTRVENVIYYALALRKAGVPVELHVYPAGGHGYGLRSSQDLVTTWPQRAGEWMRSQGYITGAPQSTP